MSTVNTLVKKSLFALTTSIALTGIATASHAADYVAGKDYTLIANPAPVEVPGKFEVREFFWYGCPHCFRLDPFIGTWLKSKPADVNFIRTPAALNPTWEQNARGFYAVELLGQQSEKLHTTLFSAIHTGNQRLFDQASLANFYASQGIDANKFNGLYNSFAVSGKIAQSKKLAMQFQLEGVPALVVDGKYVVQGETGDALKVVDYLLAKDRAHK